MKKIAALLLSLLLAVSAVPSLAEGTIAAYHLPGGAQIAPVSECGDWAVPEGLEPLYALMQRTGLWGDIYLLRMKNGRALASVSCIPVEDHKTPQELLALWPQIAQNIGREVSYVNADEACAKVETLYDRELLHIQTDLAVSGSESTLLLEAEAVAFCREDEMIEVWAVHPAQSTYQYDEAAAAELKADCADLKLLMSSLDFSAEAPVTVEGKPYADPEGRFELLVPEDAVIITPKTDVAVVQEARERFTAANEAGAEVLFDSFMEDVYTQNVTLLMTADMRGAVLLFASEEEEFAGVTNDQLCAMAQPIGKSLQERFGTAMFLGGDGRVWLSGHEHALLGYWVRSGECDALLDIAACVLNENWLYEIDIYSMEGDTAMREMLHTRLSQTLCYPAN